MVEALAAHLGLDIDAEHVAPVVDHYHQTRVQQVDPQQGRGGDEDQSPVLTREESVDEQPDRHREPELQHAREYRAGEVQGEEFAMGLVVSEETPEELSRPALVSGSARHGARRSSRRNRQETDRARGRYERVSVYSPCLNCPVLTPNPLSC